MTFIPGKLILAKDYNTIDPDFNNVSLLLSGEGANGSTTILDSSNNNFSVSAADNAQIINTVETPFSPAVPSDGVLAFDGTGDYLTVPDNNNFEFGSDDFTIEYWAYFNNLADQVNVVKRDRTSNIYTPFFIGPFPSGELRFYSSSNNSSWDIASDARFGNLTTNTWYHIAVVRNGSGFTGYVDGIGTFLVTSSASLLNNSDPVVVGSDTNNTSGFNGYISNLRITKGVARYTANFTPPTQPFFPGGAN